MASFTVAFTLFFSRTMRNYEFAPEEHERALVAILDEVESLPEIEVLSIDPTLRRPPPNAPSTSPRENSIYCTTSPAIPAMCSAGRSSWMPSGIMSSPGIPAR